MLGRTGSLLAAVAVLLLVAASPARGKLSLQPSHQLPVTTLPVLPVWYAGAVHLVSELTVDIYNTSAVQLTRYSTDGTWRVEATLNVSTYAGGQISVLEGGVQLLGRTLYVALATAPQPSVCVYAVDLATLQHVGMRCADYDSYPVESLAEFAPPFVLPFSPTASYLALNYLNSSTGFLKFALPTPQSPSSSREEAVGKEEDLSTASDPASAVTYKMHYLRAGAGDASTDRLLVCGINARLEKTLAMLDAQSLALLESSNAYCERASYTASLQRLVSAQYYYSNGSVGVYSQDLHQSLSPQPQHVLLLRNSTAVDYITSSAQYALLVADDALTVSQYLVQAQLVPHSAPVLRARVPLPSHFLEFANAPQYVAYDVSEEAQQWIITYSATDFRYYIATVNFS